MCLEESIKYAHKRRTFGKKLIEHDVIRNKLGKINLFVIYIFLAHMARQVEATHAWMEALIYQTKMMNKDLQMLKLGGNLKRI